MSRVNPGEHADEQKVARLTSDQERPHHPFPPYRPLRSCDMCGREWKGTPICPFCGSRHTGLENDD